MVALILTWGAGCGDDDDGKGSTSTASVGGGGQGGLATTGGGGGGGEGGEGGDGGDGGDGGGMPSCANAPLVTPVGNQRWREDSVPISTTTPRYFGRFTPEADTWLSTSVWDLPAAGDVVVRLWNEDGTELIASTDNSSPTFTGIDAIMYHYVSASQTYCIEVLEYEDWAGTPPKPKAPYEFVLRIYPVASLWGSSANVTTDAGNNDTVGAAQVLQTASDKVNFVLGRFDSATDVDVYALEGFDATADYRIFGLSLPGPGGEGTFGWGSEVGATITVLGADGTTIIARRSFGDMAAPCSVYNLDNCLVLTPEMVGENAYMVVEREGQVSDFSNAVYAFMSTTVTFQSVHLEGVETGTNDTAVGATPLNPGTIAGGSRWSDLLGTLETPGDADWWRLAELPDTEAHVWCGSTFHGSGIEDLTVEAFVSTDLSPNPTQTQTETPSAPIRWGAGIWKGSSAIPPLPPLPAGSTYELRVTGPTQDPAVTLKLYHCTVEQRFLEL